MTKLADYKDLINKIVSDNDNAPNFANQLIENITADCNSIDSMTNKIAEQEKRIADLQSTNIKLFLNQTNNVNNSSNGGEADETKPDSLDEMIKKIYDSRK